MTKKILSLLAFTLLNACTKKIQDQDVLRWRLPGDPPRVDWHLATDNVSKEVMVAMQEGLLQTSAWGKLEGVLAESWSISKDGKEYTFKLRPNLKWNDGKPLTAQHFVDGWERLLNRKTASEYAYFLFDIVGAKEYEEGKLADFSKVGVKAANDLTLIVKLKTSVAYWIQVPTFWVTFPIRKDVVEKFGDKWTDPKNIVSAGPYNFKIWERESRLVFEKNPLYWDQETLKKMPGKIEFRVVKEDATAVALFNNKDLDVVRDLPPILVPSLASRPEFHIDPYLRGYYFAFNMKDPAAQDIKLRKALAMAIDRTELKKILGPMIDPANSWIPPGLLGYNEARGLKFDAEQAKKLWAEVKSKPASLEYWFDQSEKNKVVAQNLQSQWKKVLGADIQLQSQEWKVYLKTLEAKAPTIFRLGWGADYLDPDTFMNLFTCASGNNKGHFCDATYDKLITEAAASLDEGKRAKAYDQAQKILLEDVAAVIPIFTETNLHLVSPRVENYKLNLMGNYSFRQLSLKK